jgi:hypothetical protein
MSERNDDLQRQLEAAQRRIATLERRQPSVTGVSVRLENPPRNSLQTISDWWHGGSTQGARSRHMRMKY